MKKGDLVRVIADKETSEFFGVTDGMTSVGQDFTVQEVGDEEGILFVKDEEGYMYAYYEVELVKEENSGR